MKKIAVILGIIVTTILLTVLYKGNGDSSLAKVEKELEGTITFVSNRIDKKDELNELIQEFEEIHPKVKVNLELLGDAENILRRKLALGELADVTLVPSVISNSEYSQHFLPLDELGFNDDNIYNYYSGLGSDGSLYTLTTSLKWLGIVYNKIVFEKAGITNIPTTIPAFMESCERIKNIGVTPIALNYTESWAIGVWIDEIPYVLDKDLEYDIMVNSKEVLSSDTGTYKSLKLVSNIIDNKYCEEDLFDYSWERCKNDFVDGNVAMIPFSSNLRYQFEDMGMNKADVGMFPIPESEEVSITGDYRLAVSKNTQYPEISKEFIKFLFEENRYANAVNIFPTLKNEEENVEIINELQNFNVSVQIHENIVKAKDEDGVKEHDKYHSLKKRIGMNVEFLQEYLMSDDREGLINSINEKWINARDNN